MFKRVSFSDIVCAFTFIYLVDIFNQGNLQTNMYNFCCRADRGRDPWAHIFRGRRRRNKLETEKRHW